MDKLLFLDACISAHDSRTKRLCDAYLNGFLERHPNATLDRIVLRKGIVEPLTRERIIERDRYVRNRDWNHPMFDFARQFKEADYIVIGTPYWDLSFAAILKVYIENIMVSDLTFKATDTGFVGLCKGKEITYITTAGGFIGDKNYGYDYICGIADMVGISETRCIKAEALDIVGFDAEAIVEKTVQEIKKMF